MTTALPKTALAVLTALENDGWHITIRRRTDPLDRAFTTRTRDAGNDHLEWTGYRNAQGHGRYNAHPQITAAQLAWRISRTRPAEGQIRPDCGRPDCVAPAHLTDRRDRDLNAAVLGTTRRRKTRT